MSHAPGGATAKGQANLDPSQVMNDPFESMLQQNILVCCRGVKGEFKVSCGEFIQLRYIGSDGGIVVEYPHDPDLVSPPGYTLHQRLQQNYRCGRILRPNAPKHNVDITQESHHCLW